jgi:hypothetical protein
MGTAQSDDLLVIESHASEDITQVLVPLRGIRETSIRCAGSDILILSSGSVWDDWSLHFLNRCDTSENPEVGVGDPGVLRCTAVSAVQNSIEISTYP